MEIIKASLLTVSIFCSWNLIAAAAQSIVFQKELTVVENLNGIICFVSWGVFYYLN